MFITRKSIEDIVENGLVPDIFKMERAFELLRKIGERSSDINNYKHGNFGELFGTFQSALKVESILATARIYDTPSTKYPTRCLKGVLKYLVDNKDNLPNIREPNQLKLHLSYMNSPPKLIEIIEKESKKFPEEFSLFIDSLLNSPARVNALKKLKKVRDKSIAHNERVKKIVGPTWESLQDLIQISKNVVGALGWAYFSRAYIIDGEYILSDDARRSAKTFNRLLKLIYK